jgi:hypothetical protein
LASRKVQLFNMLPKKSPKKKVTPAKRATTKNVHPRKSPKLPEEDETDASSDETPTAEKRSNPCRKDSTKQAVSAAKSGPSEEKNTTAPPNTFGLGEKITEEDNQKKNSYDPLKEANDANSWTNSLGNGKKSGREPNEMGKITEKVAMEGDVSELVLQKEKEKKARREKLEEKK